MSTLAPLVRRHPDRRSDADLVAGHRAGEPTAFPAICDRYERRLIRFATKLLTGRGDAAEDVVQEALFRAHRTLLRDDAPIHLSGWLHKLVRNCCLDELARRRPEGLPLHDMAAEPPALDADPDVIVARRHATREALSDLAALPDAQRHALMRRELEGADYDRLAAELGLTVLATRSLVFRARENLLKAADARQAPCAEVRTDLLRAHDDRRRASTRTYRHLAGCGPCRAFRADLGRLRAELRVLSPVPLVLGGAVVAKAAGWSWTSKAGAGVAATAALAGGVHVLGPGEPTPVPVRSPALAGGTLPRGAALPPRTALVTRTVALPARTATLPCPNGMRVAGLVPVAGRASHGFAPDTVPGHSRVATVVFGPGSRGSATIGALCKAPDRSGSLLAGSATAASTRPAVPVCRREVHVRARPDGHIRATILRGQPLTVRRLRSRWAQVRTDAGDEGYVPASALC
jgi:RNA polymerase sigma factor (sigma-70 family)